MHTVAIVGAGEVGALVARGLAQRDVAREIVVIDAASTAASGKALDIQQSGPVERFATRLRGAGDLSSAAAASVIVLADAIGEGEWRGEAGLATVRRLAAANAGAALVFAGARQRDLMQLTVGELRVRRDRVAGSAPAAFESAARAFVGLEAQASPKDVSLRVLGCETEWVLAWSTASIAGEAATAALTPPQLSSVERRIRASWPPGSYALASAATEIVVEILRGGHRRTTVFAALDGEWGVRRAVAAVPARLGPGGVAMLYPPALSVREVVTLERSLA
jgi:malate dehydrogenase